MATVWLTYSWDDNINQDVEFVAERLTAAGLTIRLDKWDLAAGQRLWDQIADAISNQAKSDAWLIYATQNSLGSEACQEEYAYALDRALHSRGTSYPVLALFPSRVDDSLIPAGIRTRLHVALTDPDWQERIVAAAQGRAADIQRAAIEPYEVRVHGPTANPEKPFAVEMRPGREPGRLSCVSSRSGRKRQCSPKSSTHLEEMAEKVRDADLAARRAG